MLEKDVTKNVFDQGVVLLNDVTLLLIESVAMSEVGDKNAYQNHLTSGEPLQTKIRGKQFKNL